MQIGFISLGCPKNQVDTEIMMGVASEGHGLTTDVKHADMVVINTCGFINAAKEEAINTILHTAAQLSPAQHLVVTGCLAQRYADELLKEMPEIDGIMGVGNPQLITELIKRTADGERPNLVEGQPSWYREEGPRVLSTPNGWAYLKIAEGCHNRCSYCAIPHIKGDLRCRKPESILDEARHLAAQGCRELVLVAQDTTAYQYESYDLARLLRRLNRIDGLEWLRILYAHPRQMNLEIIETMAECFKVAPYLDLPIQHGHDRLLKRMNRQYDQERIWRVIDLLRRHIPGIALRTTVMVGFPGETEAEFRDLQDFIAAAQFNWLGAFSYCQEEGTASAAMNDDIAPEVKKQRLAEIQKQQQGITNRWLKSLLGSVQPVLLEAPWRNGVRGHAPFQAPEIDGKVLIPYAAGLEYGSIVQVRMKRLRGADLIGEIENEPA